MTVLVVAALVAATGLSGLRWLRVAQREHYLAGSVWRFGVRWWFATPWGVLLAVGAVVAAIATGWWEPAGLVVAAVVAFGPPGLALRGTTSPLAWTARLQRLAVGLAVLVAAAAVAGLLLHPVVTAAAVLGLPVLLDGALALLAPLERRLGAPWVEKAAKALRNAGSTVVAITGSYGKTTTKGYVAHLLVGSRSVLASPASFNNRMGLARSINEHLSDGIEVFVAEMGTYGAGEITDLCSWIRPDVAVITAIGPVHLERFGSEERIVAAKSEILANAEVAVLNVDDARLAQVADRQPATRRVIRVGTGPDLDVRVEPAGQVSVGGAVVATTPTNVHPTNLACAIGVAVALEIQADVIAERVGSVPEPAHRRTLATGQSGVKIIDDTFNSNPAGARAALAALAGMEVSGRRVVVTPGMVELGRRQYHENRIFAAQAAASGHRLIIVGRTNRSALLEGADEAATDVMVVDSRGDAVAWVRENLGPDDAVLYENDLPDHYP